MPEIIIMVTVVLIIAIALFIIITYNSLARMKKDIEHSFAHIDTQLQKRFDMLPKLVDTVKGYMVHEKETLDEVISCRSSFVTATSNADKIIAFNQSDSPLKKLFIYIESYPELKANELFMELQKQILEVEKSIAFARMFYNDSVTIYNIKCNMFPANIVAKMFGFKEEKLFEADEAV